MNTFIVRDPMGPIELGRLPDLSTWAMSRMRDRTPTSLTAEQLASLDQPNGWAKPWEEIYRLR